MTGESKNFPPSELKLERLRRAGVVVSSPDVFTFAASVGLVVAVLLFVRTGLAQLVAFTQSCFSKDIFAPISADAAPAGDPMRAEFLSQLLQTDLILLVPILLLVLFVGLLQTRFLFTMGALSIDFGNLFSLQWLLPATYVPRFLTAATQTLKAGVVIFVILMFFRFSVLDYVQGGYRNLPSGFFSSATELHLLRDLIAPSYDLALLLLSVLIGISFFIAIAAYMEKYWRFRREHRMTRSEVELEYREMEASSEFSAAQRERMLDYDE